MKLEKKFEKLSSLLAELYARSPRDTRKLLSEEEAEAVYEQFCIATNAINDIRHLYFEAPEETQEDGTLEDEVSQAMKRSTDFKEIIDILAAAQQGTVAGDAHKKIEELRKDPRGFGKAYMEWLKEQIAPNKSCPGCVNVAMPQVHSDARCGEILNGIPVPGQPGRAFIPSTGEVVEAIVWECSLCEVKRVEAMAAEAKAAEAAKAPLEELPNPVK